MAGTGLRDLHHQIAGMAFTSGEVRGAERAGLKALAVRFRRTRKAQPAKEGNRLVETRALPESGGHFLWGRGDAARHGYGLFPVQRQARMRAFQGHGADQKDETGEGYRTFEPAARVPGPADDKRNKKKDRRRHQNADEPFAQKRAGKQQPDGLVPPTAPRPALTLPS